MKDDKGIKDYVKKQNMESALINGLLNQLNHLFLLKEGVEKDLEEIEAAIVEIIKRLKDSGLT